MPSDVQIGKGQIFGLTGTITGHVVIIMDAIRVSASSESKDRIKGQDGEIQAVIYSGKILELTIDFIPSATTRALAAGEVYLPADGTAVTLSGFPVVSILGVADALNSALWATEGGNINGPKDGKWTMTLNLARYPSITSLTPIV